MVFNQKKADQRLRVIVLELFPEFDPQLWHSNYVDRELFIYGELGKESLGAYSFRINRGSWFSYNGHIEVSYDKRNQGYGRRLVEARERICLQFGAPLIIIHNNCNPSFWEHMGYHPLTSSLQDLWNQKIDVDEFPLFQAVYKLSEV